MKGGAIRATFNSRASAPHPRLKRDAYGSFPRCPAAGLQSCYLKKVRIAAAKRLLEVDHRTVQEISDAWAIKIQHFPATCSSDTPGFLPRLLGTLHQSSEKAEGCGIAELQKKESRPPPSSALSLCPSRVALNHIASCVT
jgi:hypothetical protein